MIEHRFQTDRGIFKNGYVKNLSVLNSFSQENCIRRSINSVHLVLNAIDVLNFLQVFPGKILFRVENLIDLASESLLNLRSLNNVVNHHHEEMCCGISASCEKCTELIDNVINCILFIFLLLITSQVI